MEFITNEELQAHGQGVADEIAAALTEWDNNRARSKQSAARILGMSDLGGCREFIRATIAGDRRELGTRLKLPAIVGTVGGDVIEEAASAMIPGSKAQATITVELPNGMKVTGHSDFIRDRKTLVDLKSKDGVKAALAEGPSFENLVQLSGYMVGAAQVAKIDWDAVGVLVYWDRAGNDKRFGAYTITMEQAQGYLAAAVERLGDVAQAIAAALPAPVKHLQDKPESYCFHIQCEFYYQCWAGYMPDGRLQPGQEEAVKLYEKGRELKKTGDQYQRNAKAELFPDYDHRVEGIGYQTDENGEALSVKWVTKEGARGQLIDSIDVRRVAVPREIPAEEFPF